jgi:hypothetical protein
MAEPAPPEEDTLEERKINLEMWRHYDNLRQEKSKMFLTAQTILIAVIGFVLEGQELRSALRVVIPAVSIVGLVSSMLWLLLLSRNALYISFHRERVACLEEQFAQKTFTTFGSQWN